MLDDWAMGIRGTKKKVFLAVFGGKLLREAACVLGSAKKEGEEGRRYVRGATFRELPFIFDVSAYRELPGPGLACERFAELGTCEHPLCFLGRVHPGKGLRVLIPAVAELVGRGLDVRVFIAGRATADYREELGKMADELGVSERLHYLGHVDGVEKVSLLQACELLVLPSIHENFGFVVPEALAAGTPAVISPGVAIREELEATGGAVTVERESMALAGVIAKLLVDEARLKQMGKRGQSGVLAWLDPEKVAAEYGALYRECTNRD